MRTYNYFSQRVILFQLSVRVFLVVRRVNLVMRKRIPRHEREDFSTLKRGYLVMIPPKTIDIARFFGPVSSNKLIS